MCVGDIIFATSLREDQHRQEELNVAFDASGIEGTDYSVNSVNEDRHFVVVDAKEGSDVGAALYLGCHLINDPTHEIEGLPKQRSKVNINCELTMGDIVTTKVVRHGYEFFMHYAGTQETKDKDKKGKKGKKDKKKQEGNRDLKPAAKPAKKKKKTNH